MHSAAGLDSSNASRMEDILSGVNVQTSCCSWCAGLDSSNAARVVDILSGLASAGVTVIMTIHQPRPDILRLMDRMLLLSGNGQVCPHPYTCSMHMSTQTIGTCNSWKWVIKTCLMHCTKGGGVCLLGQLLSQHVVFPCVPCVRCVWLTCETSRSFRSTQLLSCT